MEGRVDLGYPAMHRPGVELAIFRSLVRRPNHYTTEPTKKIATVFFLPPQVHTIHIILMIFLNSIVHTNLSHLSMSKKHLPFPSPRSISSAELTTYAKDYHCVASKF